MEHGHRLDKRREIIEEAIMPLQELCINQSLAGLKFSGEICEHLRLHVQELPRVNVDGTRGPRRPPRGTPARATRSASRTAARRSWSCRRRTT